MKGSAVGKKLKVKIAGNLVKKIRESKELSRDFIQEKAKERDIKLSLMTLRRIEKDDRKMTWDIKLADFLAGVLDIPTTLILPEEGTPSVHSIQLFRMETGAHFKKVLSDSQGFSLELDEEPDAKRIRQLFLEMHKFLDPNNRGGGGRYKLNKAADRNKTTVKLFKEIEREFKLRDFIDELKASGYGIFANHFYRYEAFMDPDSDGVTWMGVMTKDDLDRMSMPWKYRYYDEDDIRGYGTDPDGMSWRVILKIVIKKSDENVLNCEVDADPGQLSNESEWQSNTLREFIFNGGALEMDHEEFLSAVNKEVNEFRNHTIESEKQQGEKENEVSIN